MATFFTSDNHFGHANIRIYCKRPFESTEEMDGEMERRWNSVVGPDDDVYHLGDFMLGSNMMERAAALLKRLNGRKRIARGNHDRSLTFLREVGFEQAFASFHATLGGANVWMRHHPPARPEAWCDPYDLLLCGHVHEKWRARGKLINVGVDQWDFTPVRLERLIELARTGR